MSDRSDTSPSGAPGTEAVPAGTPLPRARGCFGCGTENEASLAIQVYHENDEVVGYFTARPIHRSLRGVVHGGVVTAALDEVMGAAVAVRYDRLCATTRLEVDFVAPVPVGVRVVVRARYVGAVDEGAAHACTGEVLTEDGRLLARGAGRFVVLTERLLERFMGRADP
jgi:acyl-coenzyme A thioesterase PaaI-like protein